VKKYLLFSFFLLHSYTVQGTGINLDQGKILTCSEIFNACPACTDNQWLLPFEKFSNSADAIEVEADQSDIIDKDNYLITGNVRLTTDSNFLAAD
ncbi:uncharacterized protein METZ01_LOCUS407406, partial [marine metagenome]